MIIVVVVIDNLIKRCLMQGAIVKFEIIGIVNHSVRVCIFNVHLHGLGGEEAQLDSSSKQATDSAAAGEFVSSRNGGTLKKYSGRRVSCRSPSSTRIPTSTPTSWSQHTRPRRSEESSTPRHGLDDEEEEDDEVAVANPEPHPV